MKCLTFPESQNWLATIKAKIFEHRNIIFSHNHNQIMTTMPKDAFALSRLSVYLSDWISREPNRLFWLSNWDTDPPAPISLLQKLRQGCGEFRPPIEASGHRFEDLTLEENNVTSGLVFLVMAFNWQGYLVNSSGDYIYIGDEFLRFGFVKSEISESVLEIANVFKLKVINDIKQAWM